MTDLLSRNILPKTYFRLPILGNFFLKNDKTITQIYTYNILFWRKFTHTISDFTPKSGSQGIIFTPKSVITLHRIKRFKIINTQQYTRIFR